MKLHIFSCIAALVFSAGILVQQSHAAECAKMGDDAVIAAHELEEAARELQMCAAAEEFADDCGDEYQQVRSAYAVYEGASADYEANCN